jgi:hypothetical protein
MTNRYDKVFVYRSQEISNTNYHELLKHTNTQYDINSIFCLTFKDYKSRLLRHIKFRVYWYVYPSADFRLSAYT